MFNTANNRQVVLDTETTGLKVEEGHRVIEVGCIEMINRKLTGRHFHYYLNPEREVEAGALQVHGITNEFLQDKPRFYEIAQHFIDFVSGAELIIHNAPFDLAFLNNELALLRLGFKTLTDYCQVIDTLQLARKLHVGQRNSLDALCKRYTIDTSKRDLHGALLDADLLAKVYLAMTGGQGSFEFLSDEQAKVNDKLMDDITSPRQKYRLKVLTANPKELNEHEAYLALLQKQGKCLWT